MHRKKPLREKAHPLPGGFPSPEKERRQEQARLGEDFGFGPGYWSCIEHYFERELGPSIPNNMLLDRLSESHGLPRDRIVPVMAGSCSESEYLHGIAETDATIRLSPELDVVACRSASDAKRLRLFSPILLPKSSTDIIMRSVPCAARYELETGRQKRELLRKTIAKALAIPLENLCLHLGSDEVIKSVFRGLEGRKGDVLMALPNYFDALEFANRFGHRVIPAEGRMAGHIAALGPEIVYISNPNNPLGDYTDWNEIRGMLKVTPESTRFIMDVVGLCPFGRKDRGGTWIGLKTDFPAHHVIIIDSLSKSHGLVTERVGFAFAFHEEDVRMLRRLEPPRLSEASVQEVSWALSCRRRTLAALRTIRHFHVHLESIVKEHMDKLFLNPSSSNFCTVVFRDLQIKERFLSMVLEIADAHPFIRRVLGVPLSGAGKITPEDLDTDGSLKEEVLMREGITGLPMEAVRLSALSDPVVLTALAQSLRD